MCMLLAKSPQAQLGGWLWCMSVRNAHGACKPKTSECNIQHNQVGERAALTIAVLQLEKCEELVQGSGQAGKAVTRKVSVLRDLRCSCSANGSERCPYMSRTRRASAGSRHKHRTLPPHVQGRNRRRPASLWGRQPHAKQGCYMCGIGRTSFTQQIRHRLRSPPSQVVRHHAASAISHEG